MNLTLEDYIVSSELIHIDPAVITIDVSGQESRLPVMEWCIGHLLWVTHMATFVSDKLSAVIEADVIVSHAVSMTNNHRDPVMLDLLANGFSCISGNLLSVVDMDPAKLLLWWLTILLVFDTKIMKIKD